MNNEQVFGFRHIETGQLIQIQELYLSLTVPEFGDEKSLPLYTQPSLEKMFDILKADGYSSSQHQGASYDRPSLGNLDISDLEVVRIDRNTLVSSVPMDVAEGPIDLKTVLYQRKPPGILRRYAGLDVWTSEAEYLLIAPLPEGMSIETMTRLATQLCVTRDDWEPIKLEAVFPVPEEYVDLLEGKPGFAAAYRACKLEDEAQGYMRIPQVTTYKDDSYVPEACVGLIPDTDWKHFVDSGDLVTFAVAVPLAQLTLGKEAIENYIVLRAFGATTRIDGAEFRPVGHSFDSFDETFAGSVVLQVTGQLTSVS